LQEIKRDEPGKRQGQVSAKEKSIPEINLGEETEKRKEEKGD
jgi:hypothetical protein